MKEIKNADFVEEFNAEDEAIKVVQKPKTGLLTKVGAFLSDYAKPICVCALTVVLGAITGYQVGKRSVLNDYDDFEDYDTEDEDAIIDVQPKETEE